MATARSSQVDWSKPDRPMIRAAVTVRPRAVRPYLDQFTLGESFGHRLMERMHERFLEEHHSLLDPFAGAGSSLWSARSWGHGGLGDRAAPLRPFLPSLRGPGVRGGCGRGGVAGPMVDKGRGGRPVPGHRIASIGPHRWGRTGPRLLRPVLPRGDRCGAIWSGEGPGPFRAHEGPEGIAERHRPGKAIPEGGHDHKGPEGQLPCRFRRGLLGDPVPVLGRHHGGGEGWRPHRHDRNEAPVRLGSKAGPGAARRRLRPGDHLPALPQRFRLPGGIRGGTLVPGAGTGGGLGRRQGHAAHQGGPKGRV